MAFAEKQPAGCGVLTSEDFATAVEALIADARAKGLSDTTLLVEIEDIASQLRERLDGLSHGRQA
jgi:hypothetical protein